MSGERIVPENIKSLGEYFLYLKEIFIYNWCAKIIPSTGHCLDLGCGEGFGTQLLAPFVKEMVGIDINKKIIQRASNKYGGSNCHFEIYNGKILPFSDDTLDAVVSLHVIEHVKDDTHFVSEIYRVLKKDGIGIFTTPNRIMRLPPGVMPWNIFHVREYTPSELHKLLTTSFKEAEFFGLTAVDKVKQIEEARIRQNLKLISYDFFNLRRLLPLPISSLLIKVLHFIKGVEKKVDHSVYEKYKDPFSLYKVEKILDENVLDIIGICMK